MVKAYKHVRDAIIDGTPIDPEIQNLVNLIPHREYRDGFLFHNIKEFPDRENNDHAREEATLENTEKEENLTSDAITHQEKELKSSLARNSSITKTCAGPLFARNYFGQVLSETIEIEGETYHKISPKEVIEPGMQLHYLSPTSYGLLTITKIINAQGKQLERGTCNTPNIYIKTNINLQGEELLYIHPNNKEKSE